MHFGLNVVGTIGILAAAKRLGLLPAIRPDLERLRTLQGFRISAALLERVLADIDEV